ncbi:MAG: GFA family protein [Burkholderiales bacterium]
MKIDGGCHCGHITFEAEIDPAEVGVCHCTDCQQLSGTAFTTYVYAPRAGFRLLTGKPKIYYKTGSSGAKRAQAFCPECGSRIYASAAVTEPERYNLRVGTIHQRRELRPQVQIWCRSALDWVMDLGSVKQVPRQP